MAGTAAPTGSPYEAAPLIGIATVALEPDPALPGGDPVNAAAAQLLPEQVCRHFRMIPIGFDGRRLTLAMAEPRDSLAHSVAAALTGDPLVVVMAPANQVDRAIDRVYGGLDRRPPWVDQPASEAPAEVESGPERSLAAPGRLGDKLIQRGLVGERELRGALDRQERTGSRLGEILYYEMGLAEDELAAAVADQLRVPLLDLEGIEPSPEALAIVPEALQREGRCVPLEVDETALYVAITDPLDDQTYEAIRRLTDLRIRTYMVRRTELEALLERIHLVEHIRAARSGLETPLAEDRANPVLSGRQRVLLSALAAAALIGLVVVPLQTWIVAVAICAALYVSASLHGLRLFFASAGDPAEFDFGADQVAAIDERRLPRYTVLVPLYGEAAVVPRLTRSLALLDYPKSKLEVLLLCEAEDDETIAAIIDADLPPYFRLLVVPDAQPKTKPKACNYGIQQATGRFVVVYDAEDQPDPDQLKKALLAWERAGDDAICVQCRVDHFNAEQNLLTRLFAVENAVWFELLLPGLHACEAPIPLGGTSNHFDRRALVELGAWDPFNVTEGADLGMRLHRAGHRTVLLDSTTLEEANSQLRNWINQRSRWVKGYLQTYLVQMRQPIRLLREIGFGAFWSFQSIVGGALILVLNPILWVLTLLSLLAAAGLTGDALPGVVSYAAPLLLLLGNLTFTGLAVAGSIRHTPFHLARYALLMPIYWGLISIAAWKALYQLAGKPFYWEKTEHGLDTAGG